MAKAQAARFKINRTLHQVFGIKALRPGQEVVIRSVIEGQNTLAIMPTGAGKSLCYQLPALHLQGTTIIVSPLISLMKDQVDKLEEADLDAVQINSALTAREQKENIDQVKKTQSEFVFTTPERFSDPAFIETLAKGLIDFIVVDEAHCISEWGHDFRSSYLALGAAIKTLGSLPVLALTATATSAVVEDIKKQLGLPDMRVINTGIYRPNLQYEVLRITNEIDKQQHLVRLLKEIDGTGIIYCATVKTVETLMDLFKGAGFNVAQYHGKLKARERKENQDRFMAGALKAMVATNAFGMGIDKPDIRFVIHYQMPGSLEAYYQESGRAGRDGRPARCILFYQLEDRRTQLFFMGGRHLKIADIIAVYEALKALSANGEPVSLIQIQAHVQNVTKIKMRVILSLLKDLKAVKEVKSARFKLIKANLSHDEVEALSRLGEKQGRQDRKKLEHMMRYGQSARCRLKLLHDYFNESMEEERCGHCDNCLNPLEEQLRSVSHPEATRSFSETSVKRGWKKGDRITEGDIVKLPKYGEGIVRAVLDDRVEVTFPDGETRAFKKDFVRKL